MSLTNN